MALGQCPFFFCAKAILLPASGTGMAKVNPIPPGYRTLTTYLVVKDGRGQLEFLKKAFDAKVDHLSERPDGTVMHASLQIGDSKIMLGQAMPGYPPMPAAIYMYVPD